MAKDTYGSSEKALRSFQDGVSRSLEILGRVHNLQESLDSKSATRSKEISRRQQDVKERINEMSDAVRRNSVEAKTARLHVPYGGRATYMEIVGELEERSGVDVW